MENFEKTDGLDEFDNVITLTDENGDEASFEFLDLIEYEGMEYVMLLPADDEEADQVIILKLVSDEDADEEAYESVEDDAVLAAVFEIFKEKFKDVFNFED